MKTIGDRGKVESKSISLYEDQMNFIEEDMEKKELNFPQYIRRLVDAEIKKEKEKKHEKTNSYCGASL